MDITAVTRTIKYSPCTIVIFVKGDNVLECRLLDKNEPIKHHSPSRTLEMNRKLYKIFDSFMRPLPASLNPFICDGSGHTIQEYLILEELV